MDIWSALLLTLLAGMSTSIGGLLALYRHTLKRGNLAIALAFSAGAMLFISFNEILTKSYESLNVAHDNKTAYLSMLLAFFTGIIFVAVVDRLIPDTVNPSELEGAPIPKPPRSLLPKKRLLRSALFIGAAITLHNIPEGFVTLMGALADPALGVTLAVAIAIHNIPEGIAIAAPLYAATHDRRKTFLLVSASGLAEPIGALLGYLMLRDHLTDSVFGWIFGIVAGMMVFICIDELLPAAKRYETNRHQTVYGLIAGMMVVGVSLALLQ